MGETARAADSVPAADGPFAKLPMQFGRYEVRKELGRGQMGSVYLAKDIELDRLVALKVARVSASGSAKILKRMEIEARAAAKIDHPLICKVYDTGEIDGIRFIALQYIDGEDLKQYLKRVGRQRPDGEAVRLVLQILRALDAAHAKEVIHRDLKPENVMLNKKHDPVIMDFGLARKTIASSDAGLTQGMIVGTAAYMSPEQATGKAGEIDQRSDLYAVGVMLFEMLTGEWPFTGGSIEVMGKKCVQEPPSPLTLNPALNPQLAAVCHKMIAKKNEDRYTTCAEIISALQGIGVHSVPPAVPTVNPGKPVLNVQIEQRSPDTSAIRSVSQPILKDSSRRIEKNPMPPAASSGILASIMKMWNRQSSAVRWSTLGFVAFLFVTAAMAFFSAPLPSKIPAESNDALQHSHDDPPVSVTVTTPDEPPQRHWRSFINPNSQWTTDGDELVQASFREDCVFIFGDFDWTDYDFSFEVKLIKGEEVGLVYHLSETGHSDFVLGRYSGGDWDSATTTEHGKSRRVKEQFGGRLQLDRWYKLSVQVRGTRCQCFRDDQLVFEFDNPQNLKGAVGLWTWRTSARFRNIRVYDPAGNVLFAEMLDVPATGNLWPPTENPTTP